MIKDMTWCSTSDMLDCGIKYLHKQVIIYIIYNVCLLLNAFQIKSGLYMEYLPRETVTHQSFDYEKDCRAEFGSYVEASTYDMVTNIQTPGTHEFIVLGTYGDRQGSLKLFDLKSGKVVMIRVFKVIPMPDRFLKLVNNWGVRTKK